MPATATRPRRPLAPTTIPPESIPPESVPPVVDAPSDGGLVPDAGVWTATVGSPVGPLTLTARDGALVGLTMEDQAHLVAPPAGARRDPAALAGVAAQLEEYFAGERRAFTVPVVLEGTGFQRQVWSELCAIPYGTVVSYGELARRVGWPGASRAVGQANGRNPVAVVVPCHRVVAADGGLGGYSGGLERKAVLLDLERAHRSAPPALP